MEDPLAVCVTTPYGSHDAGTAGFATRAFQIAQTDVVRSGAIEAAIPYLDPFIGTRKVKRWDVSSECFSAAMTLHEMATGALPRWGDGRSLPNLISEEVAIRPELFPADLRDRFVDFFQTALRRDYSERFDNPADMLNAWNDIFATIDVRYPEPSSTDTAFVLNEKMAIDEGTQLILLNLSGRARPTQDRHHCEHPDLG
jgi:serine/threonine protein kinase